VTIQWDSQASLMRVTDFSTADTQEELVARGTIRELVGQALEMSPTEQEGLLLRATGADWTQEYDEDAIRELAGHPEFTGAHGAYDTADLDEDPDIDEAASEDVLLGGASGLDDTDAKGRDGER
jgi:hypothetical protein